MQFSCCLVLSFIGLCFAKPRTDVIIRGTTVAPNFVRSEGLMSLKCPEEYPWAFYNGTRCCASFAKRASSDSITFEDSDCSANWIECPAEMPRKCVSLNQPVLCPQSHPMSMGVGCCANQRVAFDLLLNERCYGQKIEPYKTPVECCTQFFPIQACSGMKHHCLTNYEFLVSGGASAQKKILSQGNHVGGKSEIYDAAHVLKDKECTPRLQYTYWLPFSMKDVDPPISGFFIADFGQYLAVRKIILRNADHGETSGTKDLEIKVSNYSDTAWLSVLNGTLDNPISTDPCYSKLVIFKLPHAVICRYVYFIALSHYKNHAALEFLDISE